MFMYSLICIGELSGNDLRLRNFKCLKLKWSLSDSRAITFLCQYKHWCFLFNIVKGQGHIYLPLSVFSLQTPGAGYDRLSLCIYLHESSDNVKIDVTAQKTVQNFFNTCCGVASCHVVLGCLSMYCMLRFCYWLYPLSIVCCVHFFKRQ